MGTRESSSSRSRSLAPAGSTGPLQCSRSAYIVYTLIVGLANATNAEPDLKIRKAIRTAQYMTVVSWLTYPTVYIIPMMGVSGANAVVGIQMGYCVSDIISKCGVGFLIYQVTNAKSQAMKKGLLQNNNI